MKAFAKCPKCKEKLTTDCRGCIDGKGAECSQGCSCEFEDDLEINWKKVPENEKELMEVENDA